SGSAAYLREKTGAGPGISPGGLLTLNPDVSDVIDRFSVSVTPRIRLLVMGGVQRAGAGCLCPEYTLLAAILRHLPLLPDEVILLDTPAGMEHLGRGVADGFTHAVVVSDTSYNALTVARECGVLARQLGIGDIILGVNRISGDQVPEHVRDAAEDDEVFGRTVMLPREPGIASIEPSILPILSEDSPFLSGVHSLADLIAGPPGHVPAQNP
ncbi:MAG: cobyrinic acid a,c-diamide synthase, partial [Methanoregula sp.]